MNPQMQVRSTNAGEIHVSTVRASLHPSFNVYRKCVYDNNVVGVTMLQVAARYGNIDSVEQLLQAQPKPNVNHQDEVGKY